MARILFIFSCFLFSSFLYSQEDAALKKINNHLDLCKKYRSSNPEKRIWHARKALSIAEKHQDKKAAGRALGEIGSYFKDIGLIDSAEIYYIKTLEHFEQINDRTNYATTLLRFSSIAEKRGDLIKSLKLLTTADSLFKLENKTTNQVSSKIAISTLLVRQQDFEKALLYLKRAEEIVGDDPMKKGIIYNNMSGCYNKMGDFNSAYNYASKTIEIKKSLNDQRGLSNIYNNLATIIYAEKGKTAEVIQLFNNALKGYESVDDKIGVIRVHNSLGSAYRSTKEYEQAKYHLLMAEQLITQVDDYRVKQINHEALNELYSEMGDWERAHYHFSSYKRLEDSINSIGKVQIIQELQTKYDTKELKQENELAKINEQLSEEKALKSRNTSILISAIGLFLILILLLIYLQYRQRKKKELLELKLEAAEKRLEFEKQSRLSELKALQSQMNPHFVFNSLNSIQDLILRNDRENSINYLGKFSDLTRKILEQSNHEYISVADEVGMIELYANLEKLRFGDELKFEVNNKINSTESEDLLLPSMFIQPYIENAFKHGLIHQKAEKSLEITFEKENEFLLCTIEDNGIGRKKANEINLRRNKAHLSFSTEANTHRIDLLNQHQENNIRLEIIDKVEDGIPRGTIVKIYFDLSTNNEI